MTFVYLAILASCLLMFLATNAGASLWASVLVALLGLLCFLDSFIGSRVYDLRYSLSRSRSDSHPLDFVIELNGPHVTVPARVEVNVVFENHLFNTKQEETLVLHPSRHRRQVFTYEYPQKVCGKVIAQVTQVRFYDAFGFTHVSKSAHYKASHLVYPRAIPLHISFNRAPLAAYSGIAFDNFKQGSDKSETLDLRPYHEGDDLREVHWKLSAKHDEMVIRIASRPTDYNIAMIPDIARFYEPNHERIDVEVLNNAIALFVSLSAEMMHCGIGHSVMLCDGERLFTRGIDAQSEWDAMVDELLSFPLANHVGRAVDLFSVQPYASNYTKMLYVTTQVDDQRIHRLADTSDVTAFVVADTEVGSYATAAHAEIISLSSQQFEGRVKDLVV